MAIQFTWSIYRVGANILLQQPNISIPIQSTYSITRKDIYKSLLIDYNYIT